MTTNLKIRGRQLFNILLDTVSADGATIRHLFVCNSREHAAELAQRIINNEAGTLAMLQLPRGQYRLIA